MPEKKGGHPCVTLIGPLPPPIGGVSSHIARLSALLASNGIRCTVLDAYPDERKETVPNVEHKIYSGRWRLLMLLWSLLAKEYRHDEVIHLHFSRVTGRFLLFALLLIKRNCRVMLTLHHGDHAEVFRHSIWPQRVVALFALRNMNKIMALSDKQSYFYRSLGVSSDRVYHWDVAIGLEATPKPEMLPKEIAEFQSVEDGGTETYLMTSGYPEAIYGYELCVELLERLTEQFPCRLIVCLYGTGSDPIYDANLRDRLSRHPKVVLVPPLPAGGFLALLSKASIYLRPSSVDSFGLAITDALDVGTPCLASDVCARDPRCETYPADRVELFFEKASDSVFRSRTARVRKPVGPADLARVESILNCYRAESRG